MQTLYGELPRAVRIDGAEYALRTDFRVALRILCAFEDENLTPFEQQGILLELLYETLPPDAGEAVRLGILFLNCGQEDSGDHEDAQTQTGRIFSFSHDAPLIYAAMQRSHGVDISDAPMHWYRFAALFSDISEDTFFARIVALRRAWQQGTLTPEERRAAHLLRKWMHVPQAPMTEEERAFFDALREGGAQETSVDKHCTEIFTQEGDS